MQPQMIQKLINDMHKKGYSKSQIKIVYAVIKGMFDQAILKEGRKEQPYGIRQSEMIFKKIVKRINDAGIEFEAITLGNVFVGRSMYMQQRTGSFKEGFSKNTFYRFLNSTKTNWLRFTSLLAADIVNNDLKDLTDEKRTNVFIVDDSLFNQSSCQKDRTGIPCF